MDAPALQLRHGEPVVSLGKIGIPVEHGPQILHDVGQARPSVWAGVRLIKFHQSHVVTSPNIIVVEIEGVFEFFRGLVIFVAFEVYPSQRSMVDRVLGFRLLSQALQVFYGGCATLRDADHHLCHQSLGLGQRNLEEARTDVIGTNRRPGPMDRIRTRRGGPR